MTVTVIIKVKGHQLQPAINIKDEKCNLPQDHLLYSIGNVLKIKFILREIYHLINLPINIPFQKL
ncbi:hypothetical protein Hanom_Chr16g01460261 [Helianthus anomalus]